MSTAAAKGSSSDGISRVLATRIWDPHSDPHVIPPVQAWDEHCRRKGECGKHPQVPNRAYLINLPEDKPKLEYSQKLLGELGFEVEVIEGVKSVQVGYLAFFPLPCAASSYESLALMTICK